MHTTTTYVESTSSSELPSPQVVQITESLLIPSGTTPYNSDRALNAFLANDIQPEIWLDCEHGEVLSVELYDFSSVNVRIDLSDDFTSNITNKSPDTNFLSAHDVFSASGIVNTVVRDIPVSNSGSYKSTAALQVYTKKVHRVSVSAGVPKRFIVPGGCKPRVYIAVDKNISNPAGNQGLKVTKYWGQIVSDSYLETEVQEWNPVSRAIDWKTVFKTVGKVIKVIAKVTEVVVPFVMTLVVADENSKRDERINKAIEQRLKSDAIRPSDRQTRRSHSKSQKRLKSKRSSGKVVKRRKAL
jgi:hypothetical protein